MTDYSDCTDFRDYIKNNFTTDYADFIDFKDYIKKNDFTTDYVDYADFRDNIKLPRPVTTLTTLVLENT